MTRLLPYPGLAAAILLVWLLLTQTFSPGQFLLGAGVAVIAGRATAALRLERVRIRSASAAVRLLVLAVGEIVRSNLAVALLVLRPHEEGGVFVPIPLALRDRHGLTLLALLITAIPGTMWVQFDRASGILLLHVFDVKDESAMVRLVKDRYEILLLEMFER